MRRSCDCLTTFARTSLSLVYSQCSRDVSHLCRNGFAIESYLPRKYVVFRNDCDEIARGRRQVRDTHDDFATILWGILSHKNFEHVQNFRDYFAPFGDTCEEITHHWRRFQDCFTTYSRCLSPAVAKQSQSSEIGALELWKITWLNQHVDRLRHWI